MLPRQQTLRAVVDWSWDLLEDRERTVLRRLAVFAGGCTLAAAEAVFAGGDTVSGAEVLDILASLVDKSILIADQPPPDEPELACAGVRYRRPETIHEYAAERAAEHPADRHATARRHTAHLLDFALDAEPRLRTGEQLRWFARIEADLDNIRAVLHRALRAGDRETVGQLVIAMGWFWVVRNHRAEAPTGSAPRSPWIRTPRPTARRSPGPTPRPSAPPTSTGSNCACCSTS
ncbi:hypothetical protein [Streptomyces litchfieldiae]|uniref:Uncharacterized protein n=1 Tax=Streptomyces litchfieldiae TaxID=3075543 RepID=A0ABU2N180_9ACTN|nr:hypothetical protein [Streptomyces sp. DSM 44938]MDT0347661.1 hypothetical protein [Streptomyces sp. DSM 44938]